MGQNKNLIYESRIQRGKRCIAYRNMTASFSEAGVLISEVRTTKMSPKVGAYDLFIFNVCIGVFYLHMCMYTTCVWCPWKTEEGARSPRTGITDGCKLSCGC